MPALFSIVMMLIVLVLDMAGAQIAEQDLNHLAQDCALRAVQPLSPTAFYNYGQLVLQPWNTQMAVETCLRDPQIEGVTLPLTQSTQVIGGTVVLRLEEIYRPPLSIPFLGSLMTFDLHATTSARNFPDG